jgi:FkbM family methyltransferase
VEDLNYCYRLLLLREPDEDGWQSWKKRIEEEHVSLQDLVMGFLNNYEFRAHQRRLRKLISVQLRDFKIYVRQNDWVVGAQIAHDKIYEPHVTNEIKQVLKPGMVMVDVGANIGYFSLLAASLTGGTGKVISFEPVYDNCDLIHLSSMANGFTNIQVHPLAVSDHESLAALEIDGSNGNITESDLMTVPEKEIPLHDQLARTVTLDYALRNERKIDVVKIDIEGKEMCAWKGMLQLIRQHRPVVFSEFFPRLLESRSNVEPVAYLNAIQEYGYELFVLQPNENKSEKPQTTEQILARVEANIRMYNRPWLEFVAYPR